MVKKRAEIKKDSKFFIGRRKIKDYLISSKKYIYFIFFVFLFFCFVGFFVPLPTEISDRLINYFNELVLQTQGFGAFEMIGYLFENNVIASFLGLVGGIILGVFPFVNSIMNGFVLGFAANISVADNGIFSLWRLLPHGIFELPALFISLGLGLRLGGKFLEKYFDVNGEIKQASLAGLISIPLLLVVGIIEAFLGIYFSLVVFVLLGIGGYYFFKESSLREEFRYSLNLFLFVVVPLLVAAAIIEGLLIVL